MKDLIICGTRPEAIKLAPLIKQLKCKVVNTGQHKELIDEVWNLFDIKPDYNLALMTPNQGIERFLGLALPKLLPIIKEADRVWIQGDTMSAFSGAFAGFLAHKKVIHIEAGLRTHNKYDPFPEEMFRVMISQLADVHFCPTKLAVKNLKQEGITDNVHLVGNTIVDAIKMIDLSEDRFIKEDYILATIHRRESIGKPMEEIFKALKELSKEINVIIPMHPNPKVRELAKKSGVNFIEPVDYKTMLRLIKDASVILTDSGGIQEEAPSFNTPVVVLRKTTERPELLDTELGALTPIILDDIINMTHKMMKVRTDIKNPFGDGNSVGKMLKIML